jgi:dTDP-4-amino-4,6-dideoxygalactose transaminase
MVDQFIPLAHPVIGDEEINAALRVLRCGQLAQGPEVAAFETEFASLVHGRHGVAVNSGTSALWLALLALGITSGDEVIVPSFSFPATAAAVLLTAAVPVFADIDPTTYCLDPDAASAAITPRTAAIVPVHLYGHCAAMDRFVPLAKRHGLALVEDAAQAHNATLHNQPAGTFGHAAAFSFYPTKNMHTIEGGMVVTADADLANTVRLLRNHGTLDGRHERLGVNARMSDLSAAIGRAQLRKLAAFTTTRQRNAAILNNALADTAPTPACAPGANHVYHQYTIRVPAQRRAAIIDDLRANGVGTGIYYPTPIHRQPAFHQPDQEQAHLPRTDQAAREVLSLPVRPNLTSSDVDRVATAATMVLRRTP